MGAEDFAGETETEADAGRAVAMPGGIAAIEAFEDARAVVGGDALAGVADGDDRAAGGGGECHADEAAGAVVFERVIGEILQRLLEENGVRMGEDVRGEGGFELDVGCESGAVLDDVGEDRADIGGRALEEEPAAVGEGQQEKFFEDGLQALDVVEETRVGLLLGRTGGRLAHSLLEFRLEQGEGGLEFVGGIGAEPAGLVKTDFEAVEHRVEHGDETLKLPVLGGGGDALVETGGGDTLGGLGERGDRTEGAGGEPPRAGADDEEDEGQSGEVAAAEAEEVGVEFGEVGREDERGVGIAGDGDAPRAAVGREGGVGGFANGERGVARRETAAGGGRRRLVEGDAALIGGGHGERGRNNGVRPARGAEIDAAVVFGPQDIGGRTVAAGDERERGVEAGPVAAVVDAVEVGFREVMELVVEALDIEPGGELPSEKARGEEQGGGEQADEQGETQAKRVHGDFVGTGRAR